MDITTFQQGGGIAVDIGTWVIRPVIAIICCILIFTVTTTEDLTYLVRTIHKDIRLGNGSSITTAIDTLDTDVTSHDSDICLLTRCRRWGIVSQITATIDSGKFITRSNNQFIGFLSSITFEILRGSSRYSLVGSIFTRYGLPYRHRHVTLRRAVQVVTAEQTATLHHIGMVTIVFSEIESCSRRIGFSTQIQFHIAAHVCFNGIGTSGGAISTQ